MKKRFLLIPVAAFAAFLFFARTAKYDEFHRASIDGYIDTFYRYREYVMIHVNNAEYSIIPVSLETVRHFDEVAKIGDKVSKRAGSDTLILNHSGVEISMYTVEKY